MLREEQAEKYLEEVRLSIESARAILDEAVRTKKELWANVVKMCYDSMEQAISAGIARKNELIPKEHPAKIAKFVNIYKLPEKSELSKILFFWLTKRGSSQYVDIRNNKIVVPHENFNENDAETALSDAEIVVNEIEKLIKNKREVYED
jgi:HEPN domain-containing protein